jgi:GNAT superfamily N-acetyltransferase
MSVEAAREATADDLERLAALARETIAELSPLKGGAVWARTASHAEPVEEALEQALADEEHHVVVGTIDDAVVGYGIARFNDLRDGGRLGVIGDLYVEPDARGVGVGEAMMQALVDWCERQGCFGVDSIALPGARETKNFFEGFGLTARAIVVHRALGEGSDDHEDDEKDDDEVVVADGSDDDAEA